MRVAGGCHCGAIVFAAEVDPQRVSICHCTDCQLLTGSAYRVTVPAARSDFTLTRGTPRTYVKTAASGARRLQAFCGDCGSPLYAADADDAADEVGLRVGTIAERAALKPVRQIWCGSALAWSQDLTALPKREGE